MPVTVTYQADKSAAAKTLSSNNNKAALPSAPKRLPTVMLLSAGSSRDSKRGASSQSTGSRGVRSGVSKPGEGRGGEGSREEGRGEERSGEERRGESYEETVERLRTEKTLEETVEKLRRAALEKSEIPVTVALDSRKAIPLAAKPAEPVFNYSFKERSWQELFDEATSAPLRSDQVEVKASPRPNYSTLAEKARSRVEGLVTRGLTDDIINCDFVRLAEQLPAHALVKYQALTEKGRAALFVNMMPLLARRAAEKVIEYEKEESAWASAGLFDEDVNQSRLLATFSVDRSSKLAVLGLPMLASDILLAEMAPVALGKVGDMPSSVSDKKQFAATFLAEFDTYIAKRRKQLAGPEGWSKLDAAQAKLDALNIEDDDGRISPLHISPFRAKKRSLLFNLEDLRLAESRKSRRSLLSRSQSRQMARSLSGLTRPTTTSSGRRRSLRRESLQEILASAAAGNEDTLAVRAFANWKNVSSLFEGYGRYADDEAVLRRIWAAEKGILTTQDAARQIIEDAIQDNVDSHVEACRKHVPAGALASLAAPATTAYDTRQLTSEVKEAALEAKGVVSSAMQHLESVAPKGEAPTSIATLFSKMMHANDRKKHKRPDGTADAQISTAITTKHAGPVAMPTKKAALHTSSSSTGLIDATVKILSLPDRAHPVMIHEIKSTARVRQLSPMHRPPGVADIRVTEYAVEAAETAVAKRRNVGTQHGSTEMERTVLPAPVTNRAAVITAIHNHQPRKRHLAADVDMISRAGDRAFRPPTPRDTFASHHNNDKWWESHGYVPGDADGLPETAVTLGQTVFRSSRRGASGSINVDASSEKLLMRAAQSASMPFLSASTKARALGGARNALAVKLSPLKPSTQVSVLRKSGSSTVYAPPSSPKSNKKPAITVSTEQSVDAVGAMTRKALPTIMWRSPSHQAAASRLHTRFDLDTDGLDTERNGGELPGEQEIDSSDGGQDSQDAAANSEVLLNKLSHVWDDLHMPSANRIDFLVRYSMPESVALLEPAVRAWCTARDEIVVCENMKELYRSLYGYTHAGSPTRKAASPVIVLPTLKPKSLHKLAVASASPVSTELSAAAGVMLDLLADMQQSAPTAAQSSSQPQPHGRPSMHGDHPTLHDGRPNMHGDHPTVYGDHPMLATVQTFEGKGSIVVPATVLRMQQVRDAYEVFKPLYDQQVEATLHACVRVADISAGDVVTYCGVNYPQALHRDRYAVVAPPRPPQEGFDVL